jgi:hypothetical protein
MKGLILKDFMNLKKNLKMFGIFTVLYGFMAFMSEDSSFFSSIFTMLIAILTLSVYSYDEMAKWDGYAMTMPISKENIVQGKYIVMLLLTSIGASFSLVISIMLNFIMKADSILFVIQNCILGAAIVILFYSIIIPFITKLGVEKARLIIFAVYMIPFAIILLVKQAMKANDFMIPEELIRMAKIAVENAHILLPPAILLLLYLSYLISIRIYRKKEF